MEFACFQGLKLCTRTRMLCNEYVHNFIFFNYKQLILDISISLLD